MKKLNKHPRLYKKMANTLKKLITNRIKLSRPKMLPGQQNKGANNSIKNQGNNNIFFCFHVHSSVCFIFLQ